MTVTELVDTARRPAAVEAALAVAHDVAHEIRHAEDTLERHARELELRGALRVLARLVARRYFVGGGAVLDRWDNSRALRGTSGITCREARDLAAEQNGLNAAEVFGELEAELRALDPGLDWPALG